MKEEQKEKKVEEAKKKVSELKKEHYARIPSSANFSKEQKSIVEGLLFDAIDEAYANGSASSLLETEDAKKLVGGLAETYSKLAGEITSGSYEKYRQLYLNQRLVTAHLQSVCQILQMQVAKHEEGTSPFMDVLSLIGTAASFSKVNPGENTFIEKDNKE